MTLEAGLLLLAVLAQGLLVFIIASVMFQRRLDPLKTGDLHMRDIAVNKEAWPDRARQAANAYDNQFQIPVLFYVAVGMAIYLGANWIDVGVAIAFVLSRYTHALVHITHNRVRVRFSHFLVGYVLIAAWWLYLAARVMQALIGLNT